MVHLPSVIGAPTALLMGPPLNETGSAGAPPQTDEETPKQQGPYPLRGGPTDRAASAKRQEETMRDTDVDAETQEETVGDTDAAEETKVHLVIEPKTLKAAAEEALDAAKETAAAVSSLRLWRQQQQQEEALQVPEEGDLGAPPQDSAILKQIDRLMQAVLGAPASDDAARGLRADGGPPHGGPQCGGLKKEGLVERVALIQEQKRHLKDFLLVCLLLSLALNPKQKERYT